MTAALPDHAPTVATVDSDAVSALLGYNLKRSYLIVRGAADEALAPHGLRVVSFTALSVIVDNPGLAPSQLAEALAMERSNIVLIVDALETAELITRGRSRTDRRRQALMATVRGRRVRDRAAAEVAAAEAAAVSMLDTDEKNTLLALLTRISAPPSAQKAAREG